MLKVRFDSEKALEAILYVASKAPDADIYHVGKILYFADCAHLEAFGRMICGDKYIAMKDGPVASGTYDIIKTARGDGTRLPTGITAAAITKSFKVQNLNVIPLRAADEDYFSDSDIECIDTAIEKYGNLTFEQIRDISHDDAWKAVGHNAEMPLKVIAAKLNNSDLLLSYLQGEG